MVNCLKSNLILAALLITIIKLQTTSFVSGNFKCNVFHEINGVGSHQKFIQVLALLQYSAVDNKKSCFASCQPIRITPVPTACFKL